MRNISAAVLALLLATATSARAQEGDVTVHGTVIDAATHKPVPGASVYREETDEVAVTDDQGEFSFPTGAAGHWHLAIVDPAYAKVELATDGSEAVAITLTSFSVQGDEIVVEADADHASAGEVNLHRDEITHVPGANGDPLKAIQNLPGVANVTSFTPSQGLIIRGNAPQDSRIFLDGFEIPILYHLGGIQSVLPGEMIDDLVYSPGGFGVEWGKASAGVVEISSRGGSTDLTGYADVSFITASGVVRGPIGKKGKFAIAVRRSYIDAVLSAAAPSSTNLSFTALPRYYDYQARADYELLPHLTLSAFLIGSSDDFSISTSTTNASDPNMSGQFADTTSFQRVIGAATYDARGVYNKLAVSGLNQRLGVDIGTDYLHTHNESLTVRDDARIEVAPGVHLIAGGQAESVDYDVNIKFPRPPSEGDPSMPNFTYDPLIDTTSSGTAANLSVWSAAEYQPATWTKTTVGVRVDDFRHNDAVEVQPRVQERLAVSDQDTLLGSFGLYTRPPDNQDENLQASLKPERSWQTSAGVEHKIVPGLTLQSTAYYIAQSDLIVEQAGRAGATSADGNNTYDNAGIGRAYGAELMLQARFDRFFGWVSYTYARSERQDQPGAAWRLFDDDQSHNLVVLGSYKLGDRQQWQVGARFQYTTGTPYTPVSGSIYDSDRNQYMPQYGAVNSLRNPAPNQLDIRIDHTWKFQDWKLSGYVDVQNVYLNAPVQQWQYSSNYTQRTAVYGLPILPAIGVRGEF
jgi:outer membrane receptor protein involved in Fe transport